MAAYCINDLVLLSVYFYTTNYATDSTLKLFLQAFALERDILAHQVMVMVHADGGHADHMACVCIRCYD